MKKMYRYFMGAVLLAAVFTIVSRTVFAEEVPKCSSDFVVVPEPASGQPVSEDSPPCPNGYIFAEFELVCMTVAHCVPAIWLQNGELYHHYVHLNMELCGVVIFSETTAEIQ